MKHLIIYHAHCNDGFGAAWAAWKAYHPDVFTTELFAASYGKAPPWDKIDETTTVHIVDFSYSTEDTLKLCEVAGVVVWIDHHKTAIEAWAQCGESENYPTNLHATLNTNYSGAMLAWNWYHGTVAPKIIEHIQDRDLWKFELEGTKEVHLNLNTLPKDIEVWDEVINNCQFPETLYKFISEGAAIDRYYQQLVQNILATNKVEVFIDGVRGLACNCPGALASDVGHHLATESGTYGFTWEELKSGEEKCSLRSNGDYDVASIAKSFGGGGHKNAAGFHLAPNDVQDRIRFKRMV